MITMIIITIVTVVIMITLLIILILIITIMMIMITQTHKIHNGNPQVLACTETGKLKHVTWKEPFQSISVGLSDEGSLVFCDSAAEPQVRKK